MLVIRVQPDEGVLLRFGSKVPGSAMDVRDVNMDFSYSEAFTEQSPEAYERLILDALLDEASLFPPTRRSRSPGAILDPILNDWSQSGRPEDYESGTGGPFGRRPDADPPQQEMEATLMSAATFTDTSTGDQAVVRNLGTTDDTGSLGRELHRLREQRRARWPPAGC